MVESLTVQLHLDGRWHDALDLEFLEPDKGFDGACRLGYIEDYTLSFLDRFSSVGQWAVSARYPLSLNTDTLESWPAFLLDIAPAGASRRFWERRLNLPAGNPRRHDLDLLRRCTSNPIGHSRIKESLDFTKGESQRFSRTEILNRNVDFLEAAASQGASVGGATGAGGDAPKFLLSEDAQGMFAPEGSIPDAEVRRHWLVKFPRGSRSERDRLVLVGEHLFMKALPLLGLEALDGLHFEGGDDPAAIPSGAIPSGAIPSGASLWSPRFDRKVGPEGLVRVPVESFYSMIGSTRHGAAIPHLDFIRALAGLLRTNGQEAEIPSVVAELVCRDLLNVVLGNSDNHGRNTSILRLGDRLALAPIYDLAPMVMDPDIVTRTTRWPDAAEFGGRFDWRAACDALKGIVDPDYLLGRLRAFALKLLILPDFLRDEGLPDAVLDFPGVRLRHLDRDLRMWGLLP